MTDEKAIKILKGAIKKPNTKDGYLGQALDMGIKALEQTRWIPVSEKPTEEVVLGCDKDGDMLVGRIREGKWSESGYCCESDECYITDCVAWMPLPPSYQGE